MDNPLVSIITPCFNGEKVMYRLLDSILSQTYSNIEFIFVNDGSTDESEKVWKSYCDKFEEKGIKYHYIYQDNQGLGAAINAGLKCFSGDYLCWSDVDDYLEITSIEKRVEFLETHREFGCVSSDANIYKEDDLKNPIGTAGSWMKHKFDENQFFWMLTGQSLFCSGCHMLRTKCFLDVNPHRYIYPARRGQNNQLLLPIYYKYKRGYIDEPLYNYIIYKKSMSTQDETIELEMDRANEYTKILKWSIQQIDLTRKEKQYCNQIINMNRWKNFSNIYIKCKKPFNYIWLYIRLKIFLTSEWKTIVNVVKCISFTKSDKKE